MISSHKNYYTCSRYFYIGSSATIVLFLLFKFAVMTVMSMTSGRKVMIFDFVLKKCVGRWEVGSMYYGTVLRYYIHNRPTNYTYVLQP